jgi:membrane fusion protein (multidrug efflux system)
VAGELRDGLVQAELALDGPPPAGLPLQHGLPGVVEVEVAQLSPWQLALRAAGRAVTPPAQPAPPATASR